VIAVAFSKTYPAPVVILWRRRRRGVLLPVKAISGKHRRSRDWGWILRDNITKSVFSLGVIIGPHFRHRYRAVVRFAWI